MRMDDLDAEEMYDENAHSLPPPVEIEAAGKDLSDENKPEEEPVYYRQVWTEEEIQADFMRAEAIKFNELLGRIDSLLSEYKFSLLLYLWDKVTEISCLM